MMERDTRAVMPMLDPVAELTRIYVVQTSAAMNGPCLPRRTAYGSPRGVHLDRFLVFFVPRADRRDDCVPFKRHAHLLFAEVYGFRIEQ